MTGFSPDWLALREPVDHAARDAGLLAAVAEAVADRPEVVVVDLGSGTGSNLRATAPHLGPRQSWRLVEHDPALIEAAAAALATWADTAERSGNRLALERAGQRIAVTFVQADLASEAEAVLNPAPHLVTASALFDLVSESWIRRFTAALAERRLPLYGVLTYDGMERWSPAHRLDDAVLAAFHAHQQRDKGFGPAAGPRAAGILAANLAKLGYRLYSGDSTWQLGPDETALLGQLSAGIASAAAETGRLPASDCGAWAAARAAGSTATIGHRDLFATPG